MGIEVPTEEWKKPTADFHLDPSKTVDGVSAAELAREKDVLRQIGEQGFDELDEVLDRLSEAVLNNPEVAHDPGYQARLGAAKKRLDELTQGSLH